MRRHVTEPRAREPRSLSRRGARPSAFAGARGPAHTFTVDFQAPGRGESTSLSFPAPRFTTLRYRSPTKLRHQAGHWSHF